MFITKNRIIDKLCMYKASVDKEYFAEFYKIDDMDLDYDTKSDLRKQAFQETQGKMEMLEKLLDNIQNI